MKPERITSRSNALMTHVRKLAASGAYRRKNGQFLCDGYKLLQEARLWNVSVPVMICAESAALPEAPEGTRVVLVPDDVMRSIAPSDTPQGVLFLCSMPVQVLPERLTGSHYLMLDGVQDPGNVGTILRTADAFDCDGLFLVNGCADLYHPKTVRATMGALFRRPVWRCAAQEACALLRAADLPLYGAALRADTVDARHVDYRRAAVAIGSEGHGLSAEVLALCSKTVRLPMSARCESLNAAVAASVLLWEMYR